jgi:hypothetical protein
MPNFSSILSQRVSEQSVLVLISAYKMQNKMGHLNVVDYPKAIMSYIPKDMTCHVRHYCTLTEALTPHLKTEG